MQKLILGVVLFLTTLTQAQNGLFNTISEDNYKGYYTSKAPKAGHYTVKSPIGTVKFKKDYLPTGEGYKLSTVLDNGKEDYSVDVSNKGGDCSGYPYEAAITENYGKTAVISIDNYVFLVSGLSKDKTSFKSIYRVYIKEGGSTNEKSKKKKKKKKSFLSKFKDEMLASRGILGAQEKEFQNKNIDKMITDYLVSMKAKQQTRTSKQKQSDTNILKYILGKQSAQKAKEDASWAEAKRYNDSVKATPEYQDLERRKRQNEANYQSSQRRNVVTLRNTSSRAVYVGKSGSKNRGTEISAGGTAKWDCNYDAYIQIHTIEGGSNAYRSSKNKVYSKNTGCGNTVNIN